VEAGVGVVLVRLVGGVQAGLVVVLVRERDWVQDGWQ
jgi:hypothetical protein